MRTALRILTEEVDPPVIPIERPFVWPSTPWVTFTRESFQCALLREDPPNPHSQK